ncbi:MAG: hypothetical protein JXA18_04810 [Chitinispirillaceae bacterium]|nr:hypothetical protein [Chitinispirillaceae bacterium]
MTRGKPTCGRGRGRGALHLLCIAGTAAFVCAGTVAAAAQGDPYAWPEHDPAISYDFRDEYPDLSMPTRDLDDCKGVAGAVSDGRWTFKWGADILTISVVPSRETAHPGARCADAQRGLSPTAARRGSSNTNCAPQQRWRSAFVRRRGRVRFFSKAAIARRAYE